MYPYKVNIAIFDCLFGCHGERLRRGSKLLPEKLGVSDEPYHRLRCFDKLEARVSLSAKRQVDPMTRYTIPRRGCFTIGMCDGLFDRDISEDCVSQRFVSVLPAYRGWTHFPAHETLLDGKH